MVVTPFCFVHIERPKATTMYSIGWSHVEIWAGHGAIIFDSSVGWLENTSLSLLTASYIGRNQNNVK